jgi:hypothetical protein
VPAGMVFGGRAVRVLFLVSVQDARIRWCSVAGSQERGEREGACLCCSISLPGARRRLVEIPFGLPSQAGCRGFEPRCPLHRRYAVSDNLRPVGRTGERLVCWLDCSPDHPKPLRSRGGRLLLAFARRLLPPRPGLSVASRRDRPSLRPSRPVVRIPGPPRM